MSETNQPTAPVAEAHFNLIITTDPSTCAQIAKHYGLSNLKVLDDHQMHLPPSGPARGAALNKFLLSWKNEELVTLVLYKDDLWIKALLAEETHGSIVTAASVWRSIESQLMGHRTEHQRNLVIVASSLGWTTVREAEAQGCLRTWSVGQRLPKNWRAPRPTPEKQLKVAEPASTKIKNATLSGEVRNPKGFKDFGSVKVDKRETVEQVLSQHQKSAKSAKQKPKPDKTKTGPIANRPHSQRPRNRLHEDLYLLAKGHYGPFGGTFFEINAQKIIQHHVGVARLVSPTVMIDHLFETLMSMSNRSYWGGYNFTREVISAGSQNPLTLINTIAGWISMIPARDGNGNEIPQPKLDEKLYVHLNMISAKPEQGE